MCDQRASKRMWKKIDKKAPLVNKMCGRCTMYKTNHPLFTTSTLRWVERSTQSLLRG